MHICSLPWKEVSINTRVPNSEHIYTMAATNGLLCWDVFGQSNPLWRSAVAPVQRAQTGGTAGWPPGPRAQPIALQDTLAGFWAASQHTNCRHRHSLPSGMLKLTDGKLKRGPDKYWFSTSMCSTAGLCFTIRLRSTCLKLLKGLGLVACHRQFILGTDCKVRQDSHWARNSRNDPPWHKDSAEVL